MTPPGPHPLACSQDAWNEELREYERMDPDADGEDMGMGVSNTIKNKKKRPDPKYVSGS